MVNEIKSKGISVDAETEQNKTNKRTGLSLSRNSSYYPNTLN